MQMKKAVELRRRWVADGDKPCPHERLSEEYDLGTATGDYVCVRCGLAKMGRDWPARKQGQQS